MSSRTADGALTLPAATILVVDDSPVNLQVLVRTLHGTGHRILAARDGRTALDIMQRARPDLVLLDVMMPEIDGFEVCRAIKTDPAGQDTIVIFLSALGDVSDKVSGLQLGAVDYITKPIQAEEVLARVATHLTRQYLERELRRSRDRLNRELASAGRMQRLILPPALPEHPAVQFAASYQTSRHAGGDYYDVLPLGADRFGVMVADVSGHGAPAAIIMAMIRAALHSHRGVHADPAAVLRTLNEHFEYLWDTEMFATAIYATVDAARRELTVACAGHLHPLLVRAGQEVRPLAVDAVPPLLLMPLDAIPATTSQLEPGDRVLFYTDGVTERVDRQGRMYDLPRLATALSAAATLPPAALLQRVVDDLERFADGHEPEDDVTLVAIGFD
ncbi:MAG TPA: SpoIIE family protein phosphatase [Vicinamibacterales bacterium]|jgi:sigma-B regulation protein RsbU (phosphoserine phosphatase)|nr:SpoIIE family protein phosphatase [Vicinamibacterales bacterium]